jgi:peptide/nickel transport system permease protein
MIRYVVRRLVLLIPILFAVAFLIFSIMELSPGDPATKILGIEAPPEAKEQLREQLGLNDPFVVRFFNYSSNIIFHFDFGISWRTKNPVFQDILPRIPISLTLASFGIIFATLFGIPLGVISAVKQNTIGDNALRVIATILVAVPTFLLAMLLILGFASGLGWLPASGAASLASYILPVITCGGPYGCAILRITRSTMLEEIRQDYVRTAKAKGVPVNVVTYKHALRNALLPVVTTIGQNFGAILGGSVVAETVFSLPGIGSLVILGIRSKDTPTVIASVLLISVFFALIMLVVDLLYAFIDPRIKAKYAKS